MSIPISATNIGGTLKVNDDGSLTFTKAGTTNQEMLNEQQAVQRWPDLAEPIRAAIERLPKEP